MGESKESHEKSRSK